MLLVVLLLLPAFTAAAAPLRIAVISDLNGRYGSTQYEDSVHAAVNRILALQPDLVVSTGDMVAGQRQPHLTRPEIERMWQAFHEHVSDRFAAADVPLAITPGNHDGSAYQGFGLERSIYAEQWRARRPDVRFLDDSGYPFHYAFAASKVLFVSLEATTVGHLDPEQMVWLQEVLARHGASYDWRVVYSHLPLWPFSHGREDEHIGDAKLQELLEKADVDLFLSGHHHAFYPGSKGGVAFVGQSCLGAGPRRLIGSQRKSPRAFTWIELGEGEPRIAAYAGPDFETPIPWDKLPQSIRSPVAELVRADLAGVAIGHLTTGNVSDSEHPAIDRKRPLPTPEHRLPPSSRAGPQGERQHR